MRSAIALVCVILLSGCAQSDHPGAAKTAGNLPADTPAVDGCVVTPPILSQAPESTEGGPAGDEVASWYVNEDRTIWMLNQNWVPGKRTKTAWFRPARTRVEATGRRLDAPAPPLVFDTPPADSYRHRFTPSSMTFPTGGCWEITAKAGGSEARFVVHVKDVAQ